MGFSGMLRRVTLVRTDVSEDLSASFIKVTRIGELGTMLVLTINRCKLRSSQLASVDSYSQRCSYFKDSCHPDEGGAKFLRNVGLQEPCGVTSHKTPFFIVTAVKTSNFTYVKQLST
jgi:hypothetical protein